MSFDISDIANIFPFIIENSANCAFLIILCITIGFLIGKLFTKGAIRKQIANNAINDAKSSLDLKYLENEIEKIKTDARVAPLSLFMPLDKLHEYLNSDEGEVRIKTLIEMKYSISKKNGEHKH